MDRKSTSSLLFRMGSSVVTWGSKKQEIVVLLTTEAEYVAATAVACQIVWIRRILQYCSKVITEPTKLTNLQSLSQTIRLSTAGPNTLMSVFTSFGVWSLIRSFHSITTVLKINCPIYSLSHC